MPQALLLGTENRAKQERLAWLLDGTGRTWVTPAQVSLATPRAQEDGPSHRANAITKAMAWSEAYGGMAIASDGGLVIPALGSGWDSLRTRRFSSGDDVARARELLALMSSLAGKERRAYWTEAVAVADGGRLLHAIEAQSGEGFIAKEVDEALVKDGFWVGAVWYFPQVGKRYADLTPAELEQVGDHWKALKAQVQKLFAR